MATNLSEDFRRKSVMEVILNYFQTISLKIAKAVLKGVFCVEYLDNVCVYIGHTPV